MGKFTRLKKPVSTPTPNQPKFLNGVMCQKGSWFGRQPEPITRQESFSANRNVALNMIRRFGYQGWMKPYLSEDEFEIYSNSSIMMVNNVV